MQMAQQEVSGHGFIDCGKKQMAQQEVSGHDLNSH
jgi:hypothetical protein